MPVTPPVAAPVRWTHVACALCGADRPRRLFDDRLSRLGQTYRFPVVRCTACGFVYVTPRGQGEVLANTAGGGAWRAAATVNAPIYRGGLAILRRHGLADGGRVLDVGCAYGDFIAFARGAGYRAEGVELNADLATAARDRGLAVRTGDLRDVEGDGVFDAVTLWDVIEHVDDPVAVLRAARCVTAPGGLVFFHTGNARFQIPKARVLSALRPAGGPFVAAHQHVSHFAPPTARRAVRLAGLDVLAVRHIGTLHYAGGAKRRAMITANALLSVPARLGGPLLTSAMGVLARRPPV